MINKDQCVILPFEVVKKFPMLYLSPPGCMPQRDRRSRCICDYYFYDANKETIDIFANDAMRFVHSLERFLRQMLLANPTQGPVEMIKVDVSDGFYRMCLNRQDITKLGIVFPTLHGKQCLVSLPLALPMGWKNSLPIFPLPQKQSPT